MSCDDIFGKLKLTAVPDPSPIELPSRTFVTEMLAKQLEILGMSPPESRATKDFKHRSRKSTDPNYSLENLGESQVDILGLYCHRSSDPEAIIYVDSCVRAAKDIGASVDDLLHIVLVHELAHHATASAVIKDDAGKVFCWDDYNKCQAGTWPSVHEYFAQALAFVSIDQNHEKRLDALRRLSRQQSAIYRTWEVLDAFKRINVGLEILKAQLLALMKVHGKQPVELEDMDLESGYEE
jgi:hypothetical protein